jgi:hypothetical protein
MAAIQTVSSRHEKSLSGPPSTPCRLVLPFERGVQEVRQRLQDRITSFSPDNGIGILVGIYGRPDSGKSKLIELVSDHFKRRGIFCSHPGGAPRVSDLRDLKEFPSIQPRIQMFHYGDYLFDSGRGIKADEPSSLARHILGRDLDLKIGIYDCNQYNPPWFGHYYDFVIANSGAHKKNSTRP